MFASIRRSLCVLVPILVAAGSASAQGYVVRSWGYYDPVPYGPVFGETYSFSPYRATVTMYDSWGRIVDMPLRPKVLYYDAPFLTPQGWYRPSSIAVMPDPRPRYFSAPTRPVEPGPRVEPPRPIPPATTYPYDGGPADPVPDVSPNRAPAPRVVPNAPPERPAAKPTAPAVPELPAVPNVPVLPNVPKAPAKDAPSVGPGAPSTPAGNNSSLLPKLGPTPMDIPPNRRPGG